MKKLFALFLCAIMALSVACATAETAPEETGKLVLYSPLTTSMIENMLAMFEADTGIKTECLAMGTGDALKHRRRKRKSPVRYSLVRHHRHREKQQPVFPGLHLRQ